MGPHSLALSSSTNQGQLLLQVVQCPRICATLQHASMLPAALCIPALAAPATPVGPHQSVVVLNLLHGRLSGQWELDHRVLIQPLPGWRAADQSGHRTQHIRYLRSQPQKKNSSALVAVVAALPPKPHARQLRLPVHRPLPRCMRPESFGTSAGEATSSAACDCHACCSLRRLCCSATRTAALWSCVCHCHGDQARPQARCSLASAARCNLRLPLSCLHGSRPHRPSAAALYLMRGNLGSRLRTSVLGL